MNNIIQFNTATGSKIDVDQLKTKRKLSAGLIAPAQEVVTDDLAAEHKAEPIKSLDECIDDWISQSVNVQASLQALTELLKQAGDENG